jgi:hypothetical protein|tara:strand:+ start:371 stop:769 length:399 start_codon:yes stop_codon:yes gene_type:complete
MKDNDHSKKEIPKKEKLEETFTTVLDINYDILKVASPRVEGGTERSLYLAVILQALLDATSSSSTCSTSDIEVMKRQATSWFFTASGVTASDFEDVCDLAGLDPSATRSFAHRVIYSKEISFIRKRIHAILR